MSFRVVITEQAEREMQSAFNWWAETRSKRQAGRWYAGLAKAIADLAENPERHGRSRERDRFAYEIRDLLFGIGRRPTHRAVFTIRGEEVVILTVRHVAQQDFSPNDITDLARDVAKIRFGLGGSGRIYYPDGVFTSGGRSLRLGRSAAHRRLSNDSALP